MLLEFLIVLNRLPQKLYVKNDCPVGEKFVVVVYWISAIWGSNPIPKVVGKLNPFSFFTKINLNFKHFSILEIKFSLQNPTS